MIKAGHTIGGTRVAIIGLTTEELRRLREGDAFRLRLAEVGMPGELIIMWGANERLIAAELARHGIRLPT